MGYARLVLVLGVLLLSSACAGQRIASAPAGPGAMPPREPSDGPAGPPAARPAAPAPRTSPGAPPPPAPLTTGYEEKGEASWYGSPYHGRRAASGEIYDMNQMTAAHRTLPFDTRVWVESLVDGTGVELRINDRGPFKNPERRIIDVSYAAARLLGVLGPGVIPVRIRVVSLPGAARSAPTAPPSASPPPAAPASTAPPSAAATAPAAPSSAPAPLPLPAPAPAPESSPPISPSATPVASAKDSSTGESPAPRAVTAAPRETAALPREAAAVPREVWSVQLAAYSTEARAVDVARGWPGAYVQKVEIAGRTVWRVRVGRYPTRREAEEAAQRMAAAGHRVLVVEATAH
jgi:rare lipoprotein A